jgi:hypothetical protein
MNYLQLKLNNIAHISLLIVILLFFEENIYHDYDSKSLRAPK